MTTSKLFSFCALAALVLTGCESSTEPVVNDVPNVPSMWEGRPVQVLGTITVQSSDVIFLTWDSGNLIDGDIISLVVNDRVVLSEYELLGPGNKLELPVTFEFLGFNYVLLFAHNEGDVPPNTAALSVDDGVTVQELILRADLETNGAYNVRVLN